MTYTEPKVGPSLRHCPPPTPPRVSFLGGTWLYQVIPASVNGDTQQLALAMLIDTRGEKDVVQGGSRPGIADVEHEVRI